MTRDQHSWNTSSVAAASCTDAPDEAPERRCDVSHRAHRTPAHRPRRNAASIARPRRLLPSPATLPGRGGRQFLERSRGHSRVFEFCAKTAPGKPGKRANRASQEKFFARNPLFIKEYLKYLNSVRKKRLHRSRCYSSLQHQKATTVHRDPQKAAPKRSERKGESHVHDGYREHPEDSQRSGGGCHRLIRRISSWTRPTWLRPPAERSRSAN